MKTELKLELMDWINHLNDTSILKTLTELKSNIGKQPLKNIPKRDFTDGKHIFPYVSQDFNEPLDDFKEYMQ